MSGFEIAGVVLGSLPLVISAMEHYAEGIATAKRFWRYKTEMRCLILQVNTERGIFINTLEQLLTGIVRVDHMTEFLANPGGEAWRHSDVDAKLRERLRDAYGIYINNVGGMEVCLKKMMEKLALGADGKFDDPSTFKAEYRRLKFSISKAEYADLLRNLKNYNRALTHLTEQSLALEPTRAESRAKCPDFKAFQSYARSLYTTLRSGWQCSCQGHAVNLRLENRSKRLEKDGDITEHTSSRIIFSYNSDSGSPTSIWSTWKEADIRCIQEKPKQRIPLSPWTQNVTPTPANKRRVRFEQMELPTRQRNLAATMTAPGSAQTSISNATPDQIQDLCKTIAKLQQPQRDLCIGYLLDELQRKHEIYPLEPPTSSQQQWSAYSFRDILTQSAKVDRGLTRHDKLRLAVDLASSVLQLYKTPWLDEQWGKDEVFFIHRPGAPLASMYEHPFVCRKFTTHDNTSSHWTNTQSASCRVIRNQTLFTLGILLIELLYGKSIEELQMACDVDCQGTPGVAWCTAVRLVEKEMEFEAGKLYSDAVRRCIRCDFDRTDMSLNNESFQQAVYDGVVALLEKTLQQFTGVD